jgi:hypothetical protein
LAERQRQTQRATESGLAERQRQTQRATVRIGRETETDEESDRVRYVRAHDYNTSKKKSSPKKKKVKINTKIQSKIQKYKTKHVLYYFYVICIAELIFIYNLKCALRLECVRCLIKENLMINDRLK